MVELFAEERVECGIGVVEFLEMSQKLSWADCGCHS